MIVIKSVQEVERESNTPLPHDLDYSKMPALGAQVLEALQLARPRTLAAASRLRVGDCC